ncbi:MAG: flippase-like domain-containing protein [Haliea sp.]|nr:flippase-like domain-containing protein [Haliea sp.]
MTSSKGAIFRSKYFRFFLGVAVGAALLFLSVKDVSWSEVKGEIENITYAWIFFAAFFYWTELGIRLVRWRVLLSQLKPPPAGYKIAIAFVSGYAANNVLPAKLGEAFRADLLGRLANVSRLTVFGSIIVERLFDMLMVLGMTAWGVFFVTTTHLNTLEDVTRGLTLLLAPIALLVILVYFFVARKSNHLNVKLRAWSGKVQNLLHGLHVLEDSSSYLKLLSSTLAIWTLNCLAIWSIMMALDIQLDVNQTILMIGITGISTAIPAAPAGIGTLQYAFYVTAVLFDFSPSTAFVASVIVQIVLLGSATVVGAIAYSYAIATHLLQDDETGK